MYNIKNMYNMKSMDNTKGIHKNKSGDYNIKGVNNTKDINHASNIQTNYNNVHYNEMGCDNIYKKYSFALIYTKNKKPILIFKTNTYITSSNDIK
ncbi:hypothetical protein PFDG_04669 [Plasmodium falciparum Dd2]|uniref:Uncharacterized protein n=1 Tax=Plasmodium falciparum (isolate Dd2) TaxID=57267 RepID=A0A0L7M5F1_PLAF4|nr:hypothetical protein PFDG_04669 [Plasmodium falciparum Dd2]